jgi:DNA-binding transcriptional ArsR family regulator
MAKAKEQSVQLTNTTELKSWTKPELVTAVIEYEDLLLALESKISSVKVPVTGRKEQVLKILKSAGHISVSAIATRIGISQRNVSSQMTYLRKDGHAIATDSLGRKFLE